MKLSMQGVRLITGWEKFMPTPYKCQGGYWTIGYGHRITPEEVLTLKSVTHIEAQKLLERDVGDAERAVLRLVNAPITQGMFDALVSFVFNVGSGAFAESTLLKYINQEQYRLAALQFCKWDNTKGHESDGLENRRAEEAFVFTVSAAKAGYVIY